MASSGWQGRRLISNWGSYSQMYADVNITSLTRNSSSVSVSGQVALIYVNTAGGTGSYGYTVSGAVQGGNTVSFNTWSGQRSEYTQTRNFSATISASATATSAGLRIIFSSGGGISYGDQTWTLTFSASATKPSGLTVAINSIADTSATFNVNLSSYGNPSSTSGRYIEAAILGSSTYGNPYRFAIASNTRSATITVSNSSRTGSTALTIRPNTKYHYGGYASNTVKNTSVVSGEFTTLPAYITSLTATDNGHGMIGVVVNHASEGSAETVTTEYSFDQSTWTTASDSFQVTVSGPQTIYVRRKNSSGTTPIASLSIVPFTAVKLYGSVNGMAEEIKTLYGPVTSLTDLEDVTVFTGYFSSFNEATFIAKANEVLEGDFTNGYEVSNIAITRNADSTSWGARVNLRSNSDTKYYTIASGEASLSALATPLAAWGVTTVSNPSWPSTTSTLALTGSYTTASRKIKKLYGSVEGESKLIFEDLT